MEKGTFKKLYVGLLLLAAAAYGILALDSSVWADEAYTFAMLRHSFPEVWRITAADVHPPLYYFLLKLITMPFGYRMLPVRLFSAVQYLLLLAVGGWQLRKLFGEKTGLMFMVLFFLFPFGQTYAAEARMYSLAALCVFLNALFAYRCREQGGWKNWAGLAFFGACAAYTHYFALVSVGIVYGLLLIAILAGDRKKWKPWLLSSLAAAVSYIPWLGSFLSQLRYKVTNEYWIEPIGIGTLVDYVRELFGANGMALYFLFAAALYLAALIVLLGRKDRREILVGLCALAVPVGTAAVGLLASILVRPVFIIRYLAPSAPLMVFFMAWVLSRTDKKTAVSAALTVLLMGGVSGFLSGTVELVSKSSTEMDAEFVRQYGEADGYIVLAENSLHVSQVLSYYDPVTPIYVPDPLGADNPYPNKVELDRFRWQEHSTVVVLVDPGQTPEDTLAQGCTVQYQGEAAQDYNVMDVWLLKRE